MFTRRVALFAAVTLLASATVTLGLGPVSPAGADEPVILPFVGNELLGFGYSGDCVKATQARLDVPAGVTVGPEGDLFIADTINNRVRRLSSSGYLRSWVGTGAEGYGGDGGDRTAAVLNRPDAIVADAAGNLYIADTFNNRVRRVDADTQVITTVAGTGAAGYNGDNRSATTAQLNLPRGLDVDANGNLFIADTNNHRVRRVDAVSGLITTIAGTGSPGSTGDGGPATSALLNSPHDVALQADGDVYVADTSNNRIRRIAGVAGSIHPIAGTGSAGYSGDGGGAHLAQLNAPRNLTFDADEHLFISDHNNQRLRRVDKNTNVISTIAGDGIAGFAGDFDLPASGSRVYNPRAIDFGSDGTLYFADSTNDRIRRISGGTIRTLAGTTTNGYTGDCVHAQEAQMSGPSGMATDAQSNVYIADRYNNRVRRVDAEARVTSLVAGNGEAGFSGDNFAATNARLDEPTDVAVAPDGDVFIADAGNHRVRRVDAASGNIYTIAGTGSAGYNGDNQSAILAQLNTPHAVAVDSAGNIYIAEQFGQRVRRVDGSTNNITTYAGNGVYGFAGDGGPATSAQLRTPLGLAFDADDNLYIADHNNRRIRRVAAGSGTITTFAGTGGSGSSGDGGPATSATFDAPAGVAVGPDGQVYVADLYNARVRRIAAGKVYTVAGNGTEGNGGDYGPATQAQLHLPWGVAVDPGGILYIADHDNDRVRLLVPPGPPAEGQLRVTTSPALPAQIVVDGIPRDSWGLTWVDFEPGSHEVCFGPAPGFTPPSCQVVDVVAGQTTTVVGTYQARGYLRVMTSPALPSTISVDGVPRNDWGVWTEVPPGTYQVCFGAVEDFDPPPCQNAVVTAGGTATVTGTFTADPAAPGPGGSFGYLRVTTDPAVGSRISVDGQWRDSWGLTWVKVPVGSRQVCFDAVLYADVPSCQNVSVSAGATTVVNGPVVVHGFLQVTTSPSMGVTVFVDGEPANNWGVWTSKPPGTYEVCFEMVPGLGSPVCQDAVVAAGVTTPVVGEYTPL